MKTCFAAVYNYILTSICYMFYNMYSIFALTSSEISVGFFPPQPTLCGGVFILYTCSLKSGLLLCAQSHCAVQQNLKRFI